MKLQQERNYKVDHNQFINDIGPIQAYILGLLWSDGHVSTYRQQQKSIRSVTCFTTTFPDSEYFKSVFLQTGCWNIRETKPRQNSWKPRIDISTSNPILCDFLIKNDYKSKSYQSAAKILNQIPKHFHYFWFLGVSDGDGCFYSHVPRGMYKFSLASSYEQDWTFIKDVAEQNHLSFSIRKEQSERGNCSKFYIMGLRSCSVFGDYLYQSISSDNLGLPRKYNKFLEIKNRFLTKTSSYPGIVYVKQTGKWAVFGSQERAMLRKTFGSFSSKEEALNFILLNTHQFSPQQLRKLRLILKSEGRIINF